MYLPILQKKTLNKTPITSLVKEICLQHINNNAYLCTAFINLWYEN